MKRSGLLLSVIFIIAVSANLYSQQSLSAGEAQINLQQNYPDPFNPSATINFSIPEAGNLNLGVYDVTGRLIEELANGYYEMGSYSVIFNAQGRSSGMYFVRLMYKPTAHPENEKMQVMKMALIK